VTSVYEGLEWKDAPGHTSLKYAGAEGDLILKYFRTYTTTNWTAIEHVISMKNTRGGKMHKPNPADVKRALREVAGEPCTSAKLNGARLFVRLVMEGEIERGGCNELYNNGTESKSP
jgi:hypothetical protein